MSERNGLSVESLLARQRSQIEDLKEENLALRGQVNAMSWSSAISFAMGILIRDKTGEMTYRQALEMGVEFSREAMQFLSEQEEMRVREVNESGEIVGEPAPDAGIN